MNYVAHNNLFVQDDLDLTNKLHTELKEIILSAEAKIHDFKFSVEEQVAIREIITETNKEISSKDFGIKVLGKIDLSDFEKPNDDSYYDVISEEIFLEELKRAERTLKLNNLKYVGLKAFVTKILGQKGFGFGSTYALANILKEKEKIEIYDVDDSDSFWPVKAIRIKK